MKLQALLVVTLAMLASACGETPTKGFEAFYSAAVDGRADEALARMDAPLASGLRASAAQSGMTIEDALRGSLVRATLKEIREVSNDGSHAVLEVTDALGQRQLSHMKKQEGRWRLASAP